MTEQSHELSQTKTHPQQSDNVFDDGFLRVEHDNYYVSCQIRAIKLIRTDFLIVSVLTKSIGSSVSPEVIWSYLFDDGRPLNIESLKVHVSHARRRLAPFGIQIEKMNTAGFKLNSLGKITNVDLTSHPVTTDNH